MTNQPLRRRMKSAVALVVAGLLGGLGATAANAAFNDVSGENGYAEHITNVQQAGIATGFNDGSFRPGDELNRGQAAAWLDRSMSRVGLDIYGEGADGTLLDSSNPSALLAEIEMTSPAAASGGGWVTLTGGVGGLSVVEPSTCPCVVDIWVYDEDDDLVGRSVLTAHTDPSGRGVTVSPVTAVVPVDGGETKTFRLVAELGDTTDAVYVGGSLAATYSPDAVGEPTQVTESARPDAVESYVPQVP